YLEHGRNKSAAAEAAHLSRPAFYERLARISRIVGADLDAVDACLSLHVALLALDAVRDAEPIVEGARSRSIGSPPRCLPSPTGCAYSPTPTPTGDGYRLRVGSDELDATVFEDLARRGRDSGDADTTVQSQISYQSPKIHASVADKWNKSVRVASAS